MVVAVSQLKQMMTEVEKGSGRTLIVLGLVGPKECIDISEDSISPKGERVKILALSWIYGNNKEPS